MKNSQMCIPMKALALPGESGDVPPTVGDEVDITGTATVSRIEGDKAYLTPKTINGEPLATDTPDLDDEEGEMRADAGKTDATARLY